ncbi:MAG: murein biosynthesis integral membrane protein MurJ, partial [Thermodesulfobacteriota bacterium]|nr:murein biosynthesis integral membrane protein MurJ [Thermodesulfobacteriota bacterium]
FSEYLVKESKKDALEFANVIFTFLSIILTVLCFLGITFSPIIIKLMAWGFADDQSKFDLTVLLTRIMFPYIFFISLVALCMGILNSLKHFAAPALAPVLLNISMILSVVIFMPYLDRPVLVLAFGVIVGGILQVALQIPFLKKRGVKLGLNFNFSHPGLKRLLKLMIPAVFGAAVYQLNIMIITLIASFLPAGSVSYLYYSDRIFQFPLALFGLALATASLPTMSDLVAHNKMDELKNTLSYALRMVLFITIPAMVGLILLRIPIVSILFQRGVFTESSTLLTARALLFFSVGLWAVAGVRVVVNAFYALQDIWTPVKVAIVSIACNLVFCLLLMKPMSHAGLALAVSLSAIINLTLLLVILRLRLGRLGIKNILQSLGKVVLASVVMGGVVFYSCGIFLISGVVPLLISIILGIAVFILCAYMFRCTELFSLWEHIKSG